MTKTNLEIIQNFIEYQQNGNLDAALNLIDDNAEWHSDSINGAWSGSHLGKQAIIEHFKNIKKDVSQFNKTSIDLTASENTNLVYEYGKLKVIFSHNNQIFETYIVSIYEIKNQKILNYRVLEDSHTLYQIYNSKT
ncbi:nuclear transport factor 2 family protein [Francisella philomiragia]|uniref:nuclear transport factor 2 family protein n=1 Tax=Francisella philomiragia TaxID=28110 RepID=UPI0019088533|nr:nuclear transport factor 2 family protein [Francisella philomiragia]MBK2296926.1 nuclear transport factor 2 family protein [Francisella philomiragia]MBK2341664.1 nuclear transport factor 2 family protein [Francisella philomiragia]